MHHPSFLLDHLPKSPRTALSAFLSLSYRETSELDANILQTKHEPKWIKKSKLAYLHQSKEFSKETAYTFWTGGSLETSGGSTTRHSITTK